jgi:hypothetical protein
MKTIVCYQGDDTYKKYMEDPIRYTKRYWCSSYHQPDYMIKMVVKVPDVYYNGWRTRTEVTYLVDVNKDKLNNLFWNFKRITRSGNYLGFRNGPVPTVSNWSKGGHWRKYGCKIDQRLSPMQEHKANISLTELEKEFNIKIKARDTRKFTVKTLATDWDDCRYYGNHKRTAGWKRSRKKKQYM